MFNSRNTVVSSTLPYAAGWHGKDQQHWPELQQTLRPGSTPCRCLAGPVAARPARTPGPPAAARVSATCSRRGGIWSKVTWSAPRERRCRELGYDHARNGIGHACACWNIRPGGEANRMSRLQPDHQRRQHDGNVESSTSRQGLAAKLESRQRIPQQHRHPHRQDGRDAAGDHAQLERVADFADRAASFPDRIDRVKQRSASSGMPA